MALISPVRIVFAGALAASALASPAHAQRVSTVCGIEGQALAPVTIQYDPFAPTGLSSVDIPLVLTRFVGTGTGAKTQQVAFYLTQPATGPSYIIQAQAGGTTYSNVLYKDGTAPANLPALPEVAGEVYYNYGGAAQDASAPINLRVTIPAGVDLSAGGTIDFDIVYICKGTGGLKNVDTPTRLTSAVRININVLSALQASYAGAALDFNEIGAISTASLPAAPKRTSPDNRINVASSGPYRVTLSSADRFTMTPSGDKSADTSRRIPYKIKFLGDEISGTQSADKVCPRATLTPQGLYIQAQLLEGGLTKAPSPNYLDTLTVTIAPQFAGTAAVAACTGPTYGNF